jgi:hypothetical protein
MNKPHDKVMMNVFASPFNHKRKAKRKKRRQQNARAGVGKYELPAHGVCEIVKNAAEAVRTRLHVHPVVPARQCMYVCMYMYMCVAGVCVLFLFCCVCVCVCVCVRVCACLEVQECREERCLGG